MVGLFINTLPVRVRVPAAAPALDWLRDLQAQEAETRQYDFSPLSRIQGWSEVPRDRPLFDTIVVFEGFPRVEMAVHDLAAHIAISEVEDFDRNSYPLYLTAIPGRELGLWITYDEERFAAEGVGSLLRWVEALLVHFAREPQVQLGRLLEEIAVDRGQRTAERIREQKQANLHRLRALKERAVRAPVTPAPRAS
jgi:non-ribosomal peptide synthetase component F